ncbi:hypothetical protein MLD38_039392 [Melastoma candidum]|uniref:Uncharacterized protein n=1 Tax=Melastoma candidum TaxID=119954 RepID=A0ACB9L1Y8_9MYRT|nr:hypothetical protein MLD38_039392 [Melastoma candidum]
MARKNTRRDPESSSPCDSALAGQYNERTREFSSPNHRCRTDQNCNERTASMCADFSEWFQASSWRSYTRRRSTTRIKRKDMDTLWPPSDWQVSRPFTRLQSRKCSITSVSFSADCSTCSKPSKRRKDPHSKSIIDLSSESCSPSSEISARETSVRSWSSRQKRLDTNAFQNCFEQIFAKLPEEKRESFCFLDCLWFSLYFEKSKSSREKVLRWIKCKHVFRKKYIVIPIVRWRHWNLLILCHFGEISPSQIRTPCMLLLDSLHLANPKRHEAEIRRFVLDIYGSDGTSDPEKMARMARVPLLLPKVPQQRNQECGHFVLYFASLFADNAPEDFSRLGYPYFMKEDWFCPSDLNSFCIEYGLSLN